MSTQYPVDQAFWSLVLHHYGLPNMTLALAIKRADDDVQKLLSGVALVPVEREIPGRYGPRKAKFRRTATLSPNQDLLEIVEEEAASS